MTFLHLLRKEYYERGKTILTYTAAYVVGVIGIRLLFVQPGFQGEFYQVALGLGLFLFGLIFASTSFSETHQLAKKHTWLMLPATVTEKLAVQILIVSILYPVGLLVLITVTSLIAELVSWPIQGGPMAIFHPFTADAGMGMLHFVVLSSVFMLGSAYFKKHQYIKTVLTLFAFGLFVGILGAVAAQRYMFSYTHSTVQISIDSELYGLPMTADPSRFDMYGHIVTNIVRWSYWILLAPFCWLVTFFRLQEVEADDTV